MEREGALPCSQEPATGPYPEPDEYSTHFLLTLKYIPVCTRGTEVAQSVKCLSYRVSIPSRGNDWIFSLRHRVQTGSRAHPASYRMGTGSSYTGDKVAGV
jgi:hypothetical protein